MTERFAYRDGTGSRKLRPISEGGGGSVRRSESYPASAALSALRVVRLASGQWTYADKDDAESAHSTLGLLDSALSSGAEGTAILEGELADGSWSWAVNVPIWLSDTGLLTQTAPTTGYLRIVATATASTRIQFQPQEAIALS